MNTDTLHLSDRFQRLYCDPAAFDPFSALHPISFRRVLPFQQKHPVIDGLHLIFAEEAHLAKGTDNTRTDVIDAYFKHGLLQKEEATNLKSVIDYFDADFFELMGQAYANAGMFICALRWYREFIQELETKRTDSCSDNESVYASVGYCLCSLGLFAEAISWSKSCIGPRLTADTVCQALIGYEAQLADGRIRAIERSGSRSRYTVSTPEPANTEQLNAQLQSAMNTFAPFEQIVINWVNADLPDPEQPEGHPFGVEVDASNLLRHKMNLIFATCGQADVLVERGCGAEAKRLLFEAAMLEPKAGFVRDRIKALP